MQPKSQISSWNLISILAIVMFNIGYSSKWLSFVTGRGADSTYFLCCTVSHGLPNFLEEIAWCAYKRMKQRTFDCQDVAVQKLFLCSQYFYSIHIRFLNLFQTMQIALFASFEPWYNWEWHLLWWEITLNSIQFDNFYHFFSILANLFDEFWCLKKWFANSTT